MVYVLLCKALRNINTLYIEPLLHLQFLNLLLHFINFIFDYSTFFWFDYSIFFVLTKSIKHYKIYLQIYLMIKLFQFTQLFHSTSKKKQIFINNWTNYIIVLSLSNLPIKIKLIEILEKFFWFLLLQAGNRKTIKKFFPVWKKPN